MTIRSIIAQAGGGLLLTIFVAALAGCGPSAELHLRQPQLTGPQQELHLCSEHAEWSPSGDTDRVLVEFPLPGATTGRPTYLLYLRLPKGESAPSVCAASGRSVHGFFIQVHGDFAGLAGVTGGEMHVKKHAPSLYAARELVFTLNCEDGSQLKGNVRAKRADSALQQFEVHRRPSDVQALLKSTPAESPHPAK